MKSKIITAVVFIIFLALCNNMSAQDKQAVENKNKFSDRLFTGGNLGLQFGTQTMIEISPIIGYKITDKISTGIGVTYRYYRVKDYNYLPPQIYKTSIYGGSLFARYYIFENFFLHGEYEALNMETAVFNPNSLYHTGDRFWIGNLLGGGGYRQAIGGKSYLSIMILYNFNETPFSPYRNPIIKIGMDLGF